MKEFRLLRYFRKWWWLIVLCSAVGGVAFYLYFSGQQTYVSQTVLAYVNSEAKDGFTPNGMPINPNEIISSWVISRALDEANVDESVDRVRSRLSVTEDIPDDVKAIQKAAWAEGLEYDYFPTEYVIAYNSGTDSSADEARAILEAVVDSYYHYYGRQYVGTAQPPASIASLTDIEYEPIELVEALDAYTAKMEAYTSENALYSPIFRSALTGYSFQNLLSEYELFRDTALPSLYAQMFGNRVANDADTLRMKYRKRIADNTLDIENRTARARDIEGMIAAYVEKNQESMEYHWGSGEEDQTTPGTSYVLGQVYEFELGDYENEQITYDKLLLHYVTNNDVIEKLRLDNAYCQSILDAYAKKGPVSESEREAALDELNAACQKLIALEGILAQSAAEYMEYRAAQNLKITSTVNVFSTISLRLYILLAFGLFFIVGCLGAIVLGRGQDFVEYAVYIDHTSGLPNRRRINEVLDGYEQRSPEPPFSCVFLRITNLDQINRSKGYAKGSDAIAAMGALLAACADGFGFMGYNDGAQFIGMFENCSGTRVESFRLTLKIKVEAYNADNPEQAIEYGVAAASVEAGESGTMRGLLRKCIGALDKPA